MKNQSRVQSPERKAPWGPRPFTESKACGRRADGTFGGTSYASPHSIPGLLSGTRVTRPSGVTRSSTARRAFTMVEMLVTLALLSLIVLALMTVFNSTQSAFRASLTQTDFLESGRLAMGLIADDLEKMTPSYGYYSTNNLQFYAFYEQRFTNGTVNFYINSNPFNTTTQPLTQYLPGTSARRTNVLENFFMLSHQNVNGNPTWVGTGYMVDPSSYPTNSLYRFVMTTNVMKGNPLNLFSSFSSALGGAGVSKLFNPFTNTVNWTHIMDGVVDLRVRAYDPDGFRITNGVDHYSEQFINNRNTYVFVPNDTFNPLLPYSLKLYGCYMFSNTVPATVEVSLGVMEDTVLRRAESLPPGAAQLNYMSNHVGQVHLFRQRVVIRNVDPAAYQ
jgi:prepilin-type N-terminal cleavage/methylation domain-containing protein